MSAAPRFDDYNWAGGREAMLRYGPGDGPMVVLALPLFEEANRTRAFGNAVLRSLAASGIGGILPDLPGQGDSLVPLETVSLTMLRAAHRGLIDGLRGGHGRTYSIGIRSGALLDADSLVYGRWHLSPQDGRTLLRELTRLRQAASATRAPIGETWSLGAIDTEGGDVPVEIAGNLISPSLLGELLGHQALPDGSIRVVRLASDPAAADRHVAATPLWRRAEPDNDPALAALLADDIASWIAQCEG